MQWEYLTVIEVVNAVDSLNVRLNALGSLGWEAVGITASDPTLGINQIHVLLRRPAPDWPPPGGVTPGDPTWAPDPTRRYAQRFWDGWRWTEHAVATTGERVIDFPNYRPPSA